MVVKSPTKPTTPRLSEAARHLVVPSGILTTGWPQVVAKGHDLGISFDWWQDSLGRAVLGKRADGKYAATVGGVTLSIPRQVGKTYFVGALLVIMCILFPGLKVVWTAHRTRTATMTFRSLQGMVKRKKIWPHILSIRVANGEQEIAFRNGSIIMFGAREQGFGRGFDEIDVEVFDEAQILSEKALEDMIAATNQSRHPHGALLFYMGTPPRPVDPGEAFTLKRTKALSGKSDDLLYLELSAKTGANPDDHKQWAVANLSFPTRTPLESMLRLRENLPSDAAWLREGLGIWDTANANQIMPNWSTCGKEPTEQPDPASIAVAVSIDRAWSSIAVSSAGDVPHIGSYRRDRGTEWVVQDVLRIQNEYDVPVVIAGRGPAASLIEPLKDAGVRLVVAGIDDYQDACAELFDRVQAETITHGNYDDLNDAVSVAQWTTGERRVWTRKSGDASMLEAATLALWGADADYDVLNSIF